jgi:integrase
MPEGSCLGESLPFTLGNSRVSPATPSSSKAGGIVPRRRFQKGRMVVRGVKNPQRCGIYREDVTLPDGTIKRVRRTVRLGPVAQLSERAAWARFQPCLDRANSTAQQPRVRGMTLQRFAAEWRSTVAVNLKASTVRAAESHLRSHIQPRLGQFLLTEINTRAVQSFVTSLALAGLSRKTVENILLTLSSLMRVAKACGYATGGYSSSDLTLPREGVKKEQRYFSAEEAGRIIFAALEPFATIWALTAVLGLRIGEVLALRVSDLDFERRVIRVRQSLDSATRKIQSCKSNASNADVPMPPQLEVRLVRYLSRRCGENELVFTNKHGRPFSANELREKQLHPLLKKLGIPRGGFHAARHGATSEMLENGAAPTVVQKQMRHSDARITLGIYGHVVGNAQREAVEKHADRIEKYTVQ